MIANAEVTWTPATPTPESNIEASHRHEIAGVLSVKTAAKAARFNAKGMPPTTGDICLDAGLVGAQFIAR